MISLAVRAGQILIAFSVLVFLYIYFDKDLFSTPNGALAIALYFLLSIITGLRYSNLVYQFSGKLFSKKDVICVPAAMNLAGYIIPIKGGGVWLFFYLKKNYGFSARLSLFLVFFNLIFVGFASVLVGVAIFFGVQLDERSIVVVIVSYFIILVFLKYLFGFFKNELSWQFVVTDSILVLSHFLMMSWLCFVLVGPISIVLSMALALFLLLSSFIKVTPGNIGVLEGAALIAMQAP
uniref:hypothetical protein n=1 Tax=Marinobacter sp. TaxID=50741 RepID=UPI00356603D8